MSTWLSDGHLASPDPLRLAYREAIRKAIRQVVHPDDESLVVIDKLVAEFVKEADRPSVKACCLSVALVSCH
jgi:hypothetical protein